MEKQFMTFTLGKGMYGINILGIREINYHIHFTEVPLAKAHVVGLLNLRGQIVTVFDTGIPLGYPRQERREESSLLIMKTNTELSHVARREEVHTHDDQVGLLVDQIGDVIACDAGDIDPVPAHADRDVAKFLEGVVKHDDMLVSIINVPELLKYDD